MIEDDRKIIDEAIRFMAERAEVESEYRAEAQKAIRFVFGEQWPSEMQRQREIEWRPCLTINKLAGFCRQVSNQQRQQRPRIGIHPTGGGSTKKIADVIKGICRHVEVNSNADTAYDTAFDLAVKAGRGYWRLRTDFIDEKSFDQDIYIDRVENPFSVYMDGNEPDGCDAEQCLITDTMTKAAFKRQYPKADDGSAFLRTATGDVVDWITKEETRVAEYFRLRLDPATLVMLSDRSIAWKDELPADLEQYGLAIVTERKSFRRSVEWFKLTAMEILDRRTFPGRYIPVVPVYGNVEIVDGKRRIYGMVKDGMDPQRMVNYWETAATESIALAPKAKWMIAEGQDEGHEQEWATANLSARPVLRYKQTDVDGQPAPPPTRVQPEAPPVGILQALQVASGNLREVLGVVDPAMRVTGNVSGKALNAEKQQSDNSNFHFYDNLTRSMAHTGKIIVGLVPYIYDTPGRVQRIIGDDGKPDVITLNDRQTTAEGEVIKNDVTVGGYDVVMDTGPGYNSKRQEAVDAIAPLMNNQELMGAVGDLYFRNSDFPGAEVIADRLASMNPLAQLDEKSDVPPAAQVRLKQSEQQIKMLTERLQAAEQEIKMRSEIERMKQEGETQREHMRQTVRAHDVESVTATRRHDVETKALSAQNVAEINGLVKLLTEHLVSARDAQAFAAHSAVQDSQLAGKSNELEPPIN